MYTMNLQSIIEVVKSSDKKSKLGQTPSLWHTPSMDKIMRLMLTEKDPALKVWIYAPDHSLMKAFSDFT
jgi:hypothetical protein